MSPTPRKIIADLRRLVSFHRRLGIEYYPRSREIDALLSPAPRPGRRPPPPAKKSPPRPPAAPGLKTAMTELAETINICDRCPRHQGRAFPVDAAGAEAAKLMVVVDYPTPADEASGTFISGNAGELFNRMLAAIGLERRTIYLTGMTRCSPGKDQAPSEAECLACQPWLLKEIRLIRPKIIMVMGPRSAAILCGKDAPLAQLRGRLTSYAGIKVMASHHPADLLKDESLKKESWHDLRLIQSRLR